MAKVLVVDDSSLQRKTIGGHIQDMKHEILYACNGEEALSNVHDYQPDCIVTDLLMPVMDGVELLKRLKVEKLDTPVIVVTANSNEKKIKEVKELGAQVVINKPYDLKCFQQAIKEALND